MRGWGDWGSAPGEMVHQLGSGEPRGYFALGYGGLWTEALLLVLGGRGQSQLYFESLEPLE